MATIFFTGFPGFLGSELLPRVVLRSEGDTAVCLVQEKFLQMAALRAADLKAKYPALEDRIRLVAGDITQPDLGMENPREIASDVREIYHLAAIYDLSVPRSIGMKVNVDGTRNMLDFADSCTQLNRFQYVSTCYVSGAWPGIFGERDLEKGQQFNNFYEETKYLAEVEVQKRMHHGLPATIYRPAIVVGDSDSGETQKYDGPYYVIRWLLRQPFVAILPIVGNPNVVRVNVVPRDFVIRAIGYLSGLESSAGKVYQLADPNPLTVSELIDVIGKATGRLVIRVPAMKFFAKAAIDYVPGVFQVMQIPSAVIDYFTLPTYYSVEQTLRDLDGSGIDIPNLPDYINNLVRFVYKHPEVSSAAMT